MRFEIGIFFSSNVKRQAIKKSVKAKKAAIEFEFYLAFYIVVIENRSSRPRLEFSAFTCGPQRTRRRHDDDKSGDIRFEFS